MARKTIKEQLHDIEQRGERPPRGYTYNPRTDPRLFKTPGGRTAEDVANETPDVPAVQPEAEEEEGEA